MNKYKITYWNNGSIYVTETKADSIRQAKLWFLICVPNDDIISIEEVK